MFTPKWLTLKNQAAVCGSWMSFLPCIIAMRQYWLILAGMTI